MIDDDLVVAGQSADEQPSAAPEKPSKPERQPRDESGKFAGREAGEPAAEPQEAPREEGGKQIPIQALDAEKARRRKAEQELFQLRGYVQAQRDQPKPAVPQEPAKPLPDPYADLSAYISEVLKREISPIRDQLQNQGTQPRQVLESTSRQIAIDRHGHEAVQAAYEAANEAMSMNPAVNAMLKARLDASDHPFGELIKWHKESTALSRVGDDPDAYIEAEVQRRLAEAGGQPAGHAQQRAPVLPERLPADFSNARNAGGRQPAYGGPKSLDELYGR